MKPTYYITMAILGLSLATTWGWSEPPTSEESGDVNVMHAKLRVSKALLASLAEQDYPQIEKGANDLAQLARHAQWDADRSKPFKRSSVEFERSAYQLAQSAEQKNQNGVVLAYFNLSHACVNCHQTLRDQNRPAGDKIAAPPVDDTEQGDRDLNFWMKKKLELSETALSAICVADFESLVDASQEMIRLGRIEGWARRTDAREYRTALEDFERANQDLLRAAKENRVDSAALAFTNLTFSCVRCHSALRSQPDTKIETRKE